MLNCKQSISLLGTKILGQSTVTSEDTGLKVPYTCKGTATSPFLRRMRLNSITSLKCFSNSFLINVLHICPPLIHSCDISLKNMPVKAEFRTSTLPSLQIKSNDN